MVENLENRLYPPLLNTYGKYPNWNEVLLNSTGALSAPTPVVTTATWIWPERRLGDVETTCSDKSPKRLFTTNNGAHEWSCKFSTILQFAVRSRHCRLWQGGARFTCSQTSGVPAMYFSFKNIMTFFKIIEIIIAKLNWISVLGWFVIKIFKYHVIRWCPAFAAVLSEENESYK